MKLCIIYVASTVWTGELTKPMHAARTVQCWLMLNDRSHATRKPQLSTRSCLNCEGNVCWAVSRGTTIHAALGNSPATRHGFSCWRVDKATGFAWKAASEPRGNPSPALLLTSVYGTTPTLGCPAALTGCHCCFQVLREKGYLAPAYCSAASSL